MAVPLCKLLLFPCPYFGPRHKAHDTMDWSNRIKQNQQFIIPGFDKSGNEREGISFQYVFEEKRDFHFDGAVGRFGDEETHWR